MVIKVHTPIASLLSAPSASLPPTSSTSSYLIPQPSPPLIINMDSHHPVCCLCGDVGFPANLFRCTLCSHRFQHSYCSNYYGESAEVIEVCDWCRSEQRCVRRGSTARKSAVNRDGVAAQKGSGQVKRERNSGRVPSPRPAPRRYKLLKDVMC